MKIYNGPFEMTYEPVEAFGNFEVQSLYVDQCRDALMKIFKLTPAEIMAEMKSVLLKFKGIDCEAPVRLERPGAEWNF